MSSQRHDRSIRPRAGSMLDKWVLALFLMMAPAPLAAAGYGWERPADARKIELTFVDEAGRSGGLERFGGAPLLLNFWASWCIPCLVELPALDRLAVDPARGPLKVVVLSLDAQGMAPVLDTFRRAKIRNLEPLVDAERKSTDATGLPGLPMTVLVAGDGRVLATRRGRVDWDSPAERAELMTVLRTALGDGGAAKKSYDGP